MFDSLADALKIISQNVIYIKEEQSRIRENVARLDATDVKRNEFADLWQQEQQVELPGCVDHLVSEVKVDHPENMRQVYEF